MKRFPSRRTAIRLATLLILAPIGFVGVRWGTGNEGVVIPGRVYRAGQPSGKSVRRLIEDHAIKTVLNLRGSNPDQPWYRGEREATLGAGATLIDFPMSSDQWLSHDQAQALVEILDGCEYPLLIHCEWGAERTGLVAAIVELLRPEGTLQQAQRSFSPYYMFLPMKDGLVMRGHLDRYRGWLDFNGRAHSPSEFRRWLGSVYQPGENSREHWECNPYPLKIVTRPGFDPVTTWGEDRCPQTLVQRATRRN